MFLYTYEFDRRAGEIKETITEARETEKTYKVVSGYIPGIYLAMVRKCEMPYLNGGVYISTERDPEAARKAFCDRAERRYNSAVEEVERRKDEKNVIENCPIRLAMPRENTDTKAKTAENPQDIV